MTVSLRFRLLLCFFGDGQPPALLEAVDEGPDVRWMDDYTRSTAPQRIRSANSAAGKFSTIRYSSGKSR